MHSGRTHTLIAARAGAYGLQEVTIRTGDGREVTACGLSQMAAEQAALRKAKAPAAPETPRKTPFQEARDLAELLARATDPAHSFSTRTVLARLTGEERDALRALLDACKREFEFASGEEF